MKERIIAGLTAVRRALGNVYVNGEQNCLNLGGALQMLREMTEALEKYEIIPAAEDANKTEGS